MSLLTKITHWFEDRLPVEPVRQFMKSQAGKLLPGHVGFWHTFGSLALLLFISQVVTGILLMIYYRPTADTAFESVQYIMTNAHFGWLIRGLHGWGATLMIVCVLIHMIHAYFAGGYKKPRELTWVVGVLILGCTVTFGFTGYLLPWNQLAYWATTVGTEITSVIPIFGDYMKTLLRGGEGVTGETLSRFYVVHVVILPWALTALVAIHLVLMRVQGLATEDRVGEEKPIDPKEGVPFFPHHVLMEGVVFCLLIAVLLTLIVVWPHELGEKADPFVTPEGIKPEWYFLPTYQLLKYFPKVFGLFVSLIPPLLLLLWPFLDRNLDRNPRARPLAVSVGILAIALAVFFGVLGHFSETNVTFGGKEYHIDVYGMPHAVDPAADPVEPPPAH